jgi:hypothetical protein
MNKMLLLMPCLLLSGISGSSAEAPPVPYKEPAAPCKWTETFVYTGGMKRPDDPAAAARFDNRNRLSPKPKVRTVYDDGTLRREVDEWMSGKKTERWIIGDYAVYEPVNFTKKDIIYRLLESSELAQMRNCFPDLSWIKPAHWKGNEKYEGKSAHAYEMQTANPQGEKDVFKAWIDAKSLLPLAMESSTVKISYDFPGDKPADLLSQMPEDYQKVLERMRRAELVP